MQEIVRRSESRQYVIPRCVAATPAPTQLHRLYNASASSVHEIDPAFLRSLPWLGEGVIDYDEAAWSTLERTEMMGAPLDDILEPQHPDMPPPDFLSLNTQGNEAEILQGGARALTHHGIAIQLEMSLRPIYRDQSTFEQLTAQTTRLGFDLVRLLPHGVRGQGFTVHDQTVRTPLGLRGGGVTLQADALYFKSPDAMISRHSRPMIDLLKGIFIGFALEYFDYCYACARTFRRLADQADWALLRNAERQYAYADFVSRYLAAIDVHPEIFPVTWTDVFAPGADTPRPPEETRALYFKRHDVGTFRAALATLTAPDFTPVEQLAHRFGFEKQAELMKYMRLAAVWDTLRRLGIAVQQADGGARIDERLLASL